MRVYDLTGRKALVTGGGRGLGEGMAQALARAGAAVVIGDIREDLGKTCADSLRAAGYYKDLAATAEAARHGWHHTGDIGYLDPDNYLYIVDRAKDMIITGGFNVYSAEVEQALLAHPAVLDCAVVGLPDDKWGERVAAVIQLHPGHDAVVDDIRAFVKARLGSVKAPKQVETWQDLPRSKVGKVLKNEVKARLLSQNGHGSPGPAG